MSKNNKYVQFVNFIAIHLFLMPSLIRLFEMISIINSTFIHLSQNKVNLQYCNFSDCLWRKSTSPNVAYKRYILYCHLTYDRPSPFVTCLCMPSYSTGQSSNTFDRSYSSVTHIYLRLGSHACGSQCCYNYSWNHTGMENVKLCVQNVLSQYSFSKYFVHSLFRQEIGNIGRRRSSKTMSGIHIYTALFSKLTAHFLL